MGFSILLRLLPTRATLWILVAIALLMLVVPPVRYWVVDRQLSRIESRLERVGQFMEDAPIYESPVSE